MQGGVFQGLPSRTAQDTPRKTHRAHILIIPRESGAERRSLPEIGLNGRSPRYQPENGKNRECERGMRNIGGVPVYARVGYDCTPGESWVSLTACGAREGF